MGKVGEVVGLDRLRIAKYHSKMRDDTASVSAEHACNCARRIKSSTFFFETKKLKSQRTGVPLRGLDAVLLHRPSNGHILRALQDVRAECAPARLSAVRASGTQSARCRSDSARAQ
jgi:hypothetical protein